MHQESCDSLMDSQTNRKHNLCTYIELPAFSFTFSMWDKFYRTKYLYTIFARSLLWLSFPYIGNGWKIQYSFYLSVSLNKSLFYNNKTAILMFV